MSCSACLQRCQRRRPHQPCSQAHTLIHPRSTCRFVSFLVARKVDGEYIKQYIYTMLRVLHWLKTVAAEENRPYSDFQQLRHNKQVGSGGHFVSSLGKGNLCGRYEWILRQAYIKSPCCYCCRWTTC